MILKGSPNRAKCSNLALIPPEGEAKAATSGGARSTQSQAPAEFTHG